MRLPALTLIALAALPLFAERRPFEDYRSIVDRQMFGQPPQGFDPTKPPSEVAKIQSAKEMKEKQDQLKSAIHFSAINVASDGEVEVGFTDKSNPQDPKHYFVRKGSMAGKWLVQEADAEKATMTLVKDGVSVELTLGEDSATGAGTTKFIESADQSSSTRPSAANSVRKSLLGGGGLLKSHRMRAQEDREKLLEEIRKRDDARKREMDEVQQTLRQTLQETKDEIAHNREVAEQAKAEAEAAKAAKEKAEAELAEAKAAKAESGASEGAGDESNADQ